MAVETAINRIAANKTSDETRQIVRWDSGQWRHEDRHGGAEQAPLEQPEPLPRGGGVFLFSNHNHYEGIHRTGGYAPTIKNNVIYYNNGNDAQLAGLSSEQIYYCCVPDCNEINNQHNIPGLPDFTYNFEPYGYYHIRYESPCRNAGDSSVVGQDETDMDNEDRIQEYQVDIGADEVSCTNTWHENDWTYDGVINYGDYAILSRVWLSCDPNTYPPPKDPEDEYIWYVMRWGFMADMNQDSCVDLADLILFCDPDNWLWTACWREDYMDAWGMKDVAGEGMLTSTIVMAESFCSTQPLRAESVRLDYESTPAELAQNITDILGFLDTVLEKDNPENKEGILEIKAVLEGWLKEVEL